METIVLKDRVTKKMTDEEFLWFCLENKDLRIERNSNLEVLIMSPVTSLSGFWNMEVSRQLANWAVEQKKGIAFDSSTGFTLPDRSVLSPDASWVSKTKWRSLSEEDQNKFAPICPEFVIEIKSKSDSLQDLQAKMKTWIDNGAQLAWLIDPFQKKSFIYKSNRETIEIEGFDKKLKGEGLVEGFVLDLNLIKL
ncbi:MAG: Uma2 family endonuclease [Cyclobacteriaceae bacterium]|jgi:Uma2 family endonuclease|nr:Uma2 family endonuclease [Cyclobacteriaceae bacterium]